MFNTIFSIFIAVLISVNVILCNEKPVVDTTHGLISGKVLKTLFKEADYHAFMGIPYAKPPIGELKFMTPVPIDPWDGILKATKEKKPCLHFNHNIKKGQSLGLYGTEDCLYLDIFTPRADKEKRAVILFIFNEHFQSFYTKTKDYAPDFFIEEDVVVVTISHRLGVHGFLSLENDYIPGNAGLKDIVMGLEWVKDNIKYFGGNPGKITLMGLQGGAAGIDLLIHSKAKNLFSAAILQSGTSWTTAYLQEQVRERAFKLGEILKITTSSDRVLISELREANITHMVSRDVHASPDDYFKITQRSVIAFAPIVEKQSGGLITEYPEDTDFNIDIPIMMGFNSREGIQSSMHYLSEPRYMGALNKDFPVLFPIRLKFQFDPSKEVYDDVIEEIKHFYFPQGKISPKTIPEVVTMLEDVLINYALDYTAKLYSKKSSKPVYYYYFDYYSDLNENKNNLLKVMKVQDGTSGAATGDEMCYLFKCPDLKSDYLKFRAANSEESTVQTKMVKLWTNFAKYGNPTPDNDEALEGLKWPPYTIENKEYLNIDKLMEIKTDLNRKRFDFWDNFIEKWGKKAVNGVITESINKKDEL